ncbi:MAG: hypothetical protein A2Y89_03625 [Chloroflexi bacterium RBG_13_51_18]|nr:MAG: hypothetical protein A2Y89_03625 [Chloroflexi bacterium RBG_13_51_18]
MSVVGLILGIILALLGIFYLYRGTTGKGIADSGGEEGAKKARQVRSINLIAGVIGIILGILGIIAAIVWV